MKKIIAIVKLVNLQEGYAWMSETIAKIICDYVV
jgi:hypothetical protein